MHPQLHEMNSVRDDKADGVQHHDLSSKVSDIIEEMCTCHQKFEPDDDMEKELGEFESDAAHESETMKTQCSEEVLQDVP